MVESDNQSKQQVDVSQPKNEIITKPVGRDPTQPAKPIEQTLKALRKNTPYFSKRQKRKLNAMRNDPEFRQAREELFNEFLATHPRYAAMTTAELQKAMLEHAQEDDRIGKQKLRNHIEAFSDGIIAVIITIMLLEIPMPLGRTSYGTFLSNVGIFLISFIVIANFWFNRHKTFALTEEVTEGIIIQDFLFTGLLSLIPLLTKWIMVQPTRFSSLNYGVVLVLILLQQEGLSYSITKDHFRRMPKSFGFWRKIWASRLLFTFLINILITVIAVIFPLYGHWLFVIVPIFYFLFQMLGDRDRAQQFELEEHEVGVPYLKD